MRVPSWLKISGAIVGGAVAGNVAAWSQAVVAGQHAPFTAGTILLPAVPGVLAALLALFTHKPGFGRQ